MKNLYWMILLSMFAACSLLKNTSKQTDRELAVATSQSTLKAELTTQAKLNSASILLINDSADNSYTMQLWPKGVFTFSAGQGFKGEAEKVLISGKLKQGTTTSKKENLSEANNSTQTVTVATRDQLKTQSDKKKVDAEVSWKVIVLLILLTVAALCWIINFLNKKIWL